MWNRRWFLSLLAVLAAIGPGSAHAAPFDLIFADSLVVESPPGISGFNVGADVAMIVNTGASSIGDDELFGATFTAVSSDPLVTTFPFVNNPGPPVAPILPLEAVGTVSTGSALLARVLPGETARNTWPLQVYGLIVNYPPGYVGTVALSIEMTMGADVARYVTLVTIRPGVAFDVATLHAGRTSSVSYPTPARAASWGALKSIYR